MTTVVAVASAVVSGGDVAVAIVVAYEAIM